jgi:hypothetical protein
MRRRGQDWGRDGLDRRFAEAWRRFADVAPARLEVRTGAGPAGLRHAWLEVLGGRTPPRAGHVVRM